MRNFSSLVILFFLRGPVVFSQSSMQWPRAFVSEGYTIKIYQPQVEYYNGNIVKSRGAFSILGNGKTDPVFGALC